MARVYLGLGSNMGDRAGNIREALRRLGAYVRLDQVSSLYETEPVGLVDQPWFLNLVCGGESDLSPEELLHGAKSIERQMGRVEDGPRFGPRPIDIDMLFYDDLVLTTPDLIIPHPRLHQRGFTLFPLHEIARDLLHPGLGMTVAQLLQKAQSLEKVHLYKVKDAQANS